MRLCPLIILLTFVSHSIAALAPADPTTKPIGGLKSRTRLIGHAAPIRAIVYAPDGRSIVSADEDGVILVWNLRNPKRPAHKFAGPAKTAVLTLSFSPDGKTLAAANADGVVRLWEPDSGELRKQITVSSVTAARFSPEGNSLVCTRGMIPESNDDRDHVEVFDTISGAKRGIIDVDFEYVVDAVFSTDGNTIAISGGESLTDVPADKNGKQRNRIELWDAVSSASTQPVDRKVESHPKRSIGESPQPLLSPAFSGGGRLIAAAAGDWLVWSTAEGKALATLRAPQFKARCCAISPNVRWVATGAIDSTVALFNTTNWQMAFQSQADPSLDVTAMCFSPDGSLLVAARGTSIEIFPVPAR